MSCLLMNEKAFLHKVQKERKAVVENLGDRRAHLNLVGRRRMGRSRAGKGAWNQMKNSL